MSLALYGHAASSHTVHAIAHVQHETRAMAAGPASTVIGHETPPPHGLHGARAAPAVPRVDANRALRSLASSCHGTGLSPPLGCHSLLVGAAVVAPERPLSRRTRMRHRFQAQHAYAAYSVPPPYAPPPLGEPPPLATRPSPSRASHGPLAPGTLAAVQPRATTASHYHMSASRMHRTSCRPHVLTLDPPAASAAAPTRAPVECDAVIVCEQG